MKRTCTVGLRVDDEFLRVLKVAVELSHLRDKDELDVIEQLALVVYLEARGALEEEVHAAILPVWRPYIETVPELRRVETHYL